MTREIPGYRRFLIRSGPCRSPPFGTLEHPCFPLLVARMLHAGSALAARWLHQPARAASPRMLRSISAARTPVTPLGDVFVHHRRVRRRVTESGLDLPDRAGGECGEMAKVVKPKFRDPCSRAGAVPDPESSSMPSGCRRPFHGEQQRLRIVGDERSEVRLELGSDPVGQHNESRTGIGLRLWNTRPRPLTSPLVRSTRTMARWPSTITCTSRQAETLAPAQPAVCGQEHSYPVPPLDAIGHFLYVTQRWDAALPSSRRGCPQAARVLAQHGVIHSGGEDRPQQPVRLRSHCRLRLRQSMVPPPYAVRGNAAERQRPELRENIDPQDARVHLSRSRPKRSILQPLPRIRLTLPRRGTTDVPPVRTIVSSRASQRFVSAFVLNVVGPFTRLPSRGW